MGLTSLGCYFKINEAFIGSKSIMLGIFIPFIFFIFILTLPLCYLFLVDEEDRKTNGRGKKIILMVQCFYIISIISNCFLLTNFTQYKYILMVLFLIIIDFLLLEIYHSYIITNEYFYLTFLPLIMANLLLIVIYSFIWIEGTKIIINISIIASVGILYIIIVNYIMKNYEEEEYLFGVYIFSYGVFLPGTLLVTITLLLIIYGIMRCCGKSFDNKDESSHEHEFVQEPSNVKCKVCQKPLEGTSAFVCHGCPLVLCDNCNNVILNGNKAKQVHTHPLVLTLRYNWYCDLCKQRFKKNASFYCKPCDFDACSRCYVGI
jgi:hypothetical protein